MPWTAGDVDGFKKGLSDKEKKQWVGTANGVLKSCLAGGGKQKECEGKAVRVANSKFSQKTAFNGIRGLQAIDIDRRRAENVPPPIHRILRKAYVAGLAPTEAWARVKTAGWHKNEEGNWVKKQFEVEDMKIPDLLTPDQRDRLNAAVDICVQAGGEKGACLANALQKLRITGFSSDKKFQNLRVTPPDPRDGHQHQAAFDEDGNGGTSQDGVPLHNHMVRNFKVEPFYGYFDPDGNENGGQDIDGDGDGYFVSVHPGSMAFSENKKSSMTPTQQANFKKCMQNGGNEKDCMEHLFDETSMPAGEFEMEIFRPGTHNGDPFTEADLEEIAANYHKLKDEVRPKLKITHRDHQESVAGLASYGDVVDVFMKKGKDGMRRLFARLSNVPTEVMDFIKSRRFPERSIEIYPSFKLGTIESSPVYKNVLKAIALLGHEMPAVTGMEPILLEECLECQGTMCFRENIFTKQVSGESQKALELASSMKAFEVDLTLNSPKGGE